MEIPNFASIDELADGLRDGRCSAVDLAHHSLERIETYDKRLDAFVCLTQKRALREAEAADARLATDPQAPVLCVIPYAAKDIIDVIGEITGAGCPILKDNRVASDASVISKLSAGGIVLVGKT